MSQYDYAKLRPIEVKPMIHRGQAVFFLRDPLELSSHYALVPQQLGIVLAACDGTQTIMQVQQEVLSRTALFISRSEVESLLGQLDKLYLLDNDRAAEARVQALEAYRRTSFRPPALSGRGYPADPADLRRELQAFMDKTSLLAELETGHGLFCPHIDYFRGGLVYAQVWKRAAKLAREAECVVVFGTDHNSFMPGQITLTRQNYATPFGVLPTDQRGVDAVIDVIGEEEAFAEEIHHRREHSIELVLIWLHFVREGKPCPIVPILCGSFQHFIEDGEKPADNARLNEIIAAIKKATNGRQTLVLASGDLAHLGPAFNGPPVDLPGKARLKSDDDIMLAPLCAGDPDAFFEIIRQGRGERNVCGTAPFYLTMKLMGEVKGELVSYDRCLADENGTSFVSICGMVFA
jgi:AmmeMemoRadiSam system protein B